MPNPWTDRAALEAFSSMSDVLTKVTDRDVHIAAAGKEEMGWDVGVALPGRQDQSTMVKTSRQCANRAGRAIHYCRLPDKSCPLTGALWQVTNK
jgi:hypothetical protein